MARLYLLCVPLKCAGELDWEAGLRKYIKDEYIKKAARYANACLIINQWRREGARRNPENPMKQLGKFSRYYYQLEWLDVWFPEIEDRASIKFTW